MTSRSKSLLVLGCVLALSGATACLTSSASDNGGELNPQPLPPGDPETSRAPENDTASGGATGVSSSSGGGSSGTTPPPAPDGGADAPEGG